MANEFRIKHGLIVTGSSYFSESMFAPNLPEETSPDDYITWRQSDGRFEITPKGAAASVLAIGCWDYAGYSITPTSGEFTIRGNGSDDLETATVLQFHKTDKNSTDQSSYFNNIGSGTVLTFTTQTGIIKFQVQGFTLNGNVYWFTVVHLTGTEELSASEEICLTTTAITSGGSNSTSGTSGGGSSLNTSNCVLYEMAASFANVNAGSGFDGTAVFNNPPGFSYPLGEISTSTAGIFVDAISANPNSQTSVVFWSQTIGGTSSSPSLIKISYTNFVTYFTAFITLGPGGQGVTGSSMYVDLTYSSGDINYTIQTGDIFTICPG